MKTLKAYLKWFHVSRSRFGGDREARKRSLSWLLNEQEVPGVGWVTIDERSGRVGVGGKTDISRRARESGKILAVRSFENPGLNRWLWIEVLPLASAADAQSMVRELHTGLVPSPARVKILREERVEGPDILEITEPWFYEQRTLGPLGPGTGRLLGGSVDDVAFIVAASGPDEGWPWTDVIPVASALAAKIKGETDRA